MTYAYVNVHMRTASWHLSVLSAVQCTFRAFSLCKTGSVLGNCSTRNALDGYRLPIFVRGAHYAYIYAHKYIICTYCIRINCVQDVQAAYAVMYFTRRDRGKNLLYTSFVYKQVALHEVP